MKISIFYEEPDPDRWLPFDRHPRRIVRRLIRGKRRPGGPERVFLNLCAGLDAIGVSYRVNEYGRARRHPDEIACIIGKPHVLDKIAWRNPILFGAATFSHPIEHPDFFERYPTVQKILVPGEWMRKMWEPYYGERVRAWPVGIDTQLWAPRIPSTEKSHDFVLYDKVLWKHGEFEQSLIRPIRDALSGRNLTWKEIRYGSYREEQFHEALQECGAMIFLCEHETQGIAYQQALSAGVPILAWDHGGYWPDPSFYPDKVKFGPVSSVPYWDGRCGMKFAGREDFPDCLDEFLSAQNQAGFAPRDFILENLTLEKSARRYLEIYHEVEAAL